MRTLYGRLLAASLGALVLSSALFAAPTTAPTTFSYSVPGYWTRSDLTLRTRDGLLQLVDSGGRILKAQRLDTVSAVLITGARERNDTLTVDLSAGPLSLPGGVRFDGGRGGFDTLKVRGDGRMSGSYLPSKTTFGDGRITVGPVVIDFTGLEPTTIEDVEDYQFITTGSQDVVTVESPSPGALVVSGTSDGVAFETLTIRRFGELTIDTGTNDDATSGAGANDRVTLNGLLEGQGVAEASNLRVTTGLGDDSIDLKEDGPPATDLGGLDIDAGAGADELELNGPLDWTLEDGSVATPEQIVAALAGLGAGNRANVQGGPGDDVLDCSGWSGYSFIVGYGGNDTLLRGPGGGHLIGGPGNDTVDGGGTNSGYDAAYQGGDGTFFATSTQFLGPEGNDTTANLTHLFIFAGNGNDTINLTRFTGKSLVVAGGGANIVRGAAGDDTVYGGSGQTSFYGNAGSDFFLGGTGVNIAFGGPGDDFIYGGPLADQLHGGDGNDSIQAGGGDDGVTGDNDQLRGEFGNDRLSGGPGNDALFGADGNDRLDGGTGDDNLTGGTGDDLSYFLGATSTESDSVFESSAGGFDRLNFGVLPASDPVLVNLGSDTLATHVNRTILAGTGQAPNFEAVSGGAGDDTLIGNSAANSLAGFGGDDTISGMGGSDILLGGDGNDTLDGGTEFDRADGGGGTDTALNCERTTGVP